MKKTLALTVSALALSAAAAFATPPLGSSTSEVDQIGTANTANVDQSRSTDSVFVTNESYVYQGTLGAGAGNNANVTQRDNGANPKNDVLNRSTVTQDGTWNSATVKQTGHIGAQGNDAAQNIVDITQVGNGAKNTKNTVTVTQNSDDGPVLGDSTTKATVYQYVGQNNNVEITQKGSSDTVSKATVTQENGDNNNAYVHQSDTAAYDKGKTTNTLGLTQNGSGNTATVTQGGDSLGHVLVQNNNATIEQDGNTSSATVTQSGIGGGNTVNLYQYDSVNHSTIIQATAGGSNEGDVYQHSQNNTDNIDQATSSGGSQYNYASISQSLGSNVATVRQP